MSFYQLVIEQKTSTTIRWAESGTRPKMCDIGVKQISDINIIPSLFRKKHACWSYCHVCCCTENGANHWHIIRGILDFNPANDGDIKTQKLHLSQGPRWLFISSPYRVVVNCPSRQLNMELLWTKHNIWLVVSTPPKNISQLGWWNSQYIEMFQTTNQICSYTFCVCLFHCVFGYVLKMLFFFIHVPSKPQVRPHPNNTHKQYHTLVTRGGMKTLAIRNDLDFRFLGFRVWI